MNLAQDPNAPPGHAASSGLHMAGLRSGEEQRREGLEGCLEEGGRGQVAQSRERITTGACPERALGDYERACRGPEPAHTWDEVGSWAPAYTGHQRRLFKNCMFKKCLALSHMPAHAVFAVKAGDCAHFPQMEKGGDVTHSRSRSKFTEEPRPQGPCSVSWPSLNPSVGVRGSPTKPLLGRLGWCLGASSSSGSR